MQSSVKNLQALIILGLISTVVIITPTISIDPINLPKFVTLSFFALMIFIYVLANTNLIILKSKLIFLLLLLFPIWILISLFMSKINILNGLFGFTGRNTGAITYISFWFFMIGATIVSSSSFVYVLLRSISAAGVLHVIYGFVQLLDLEPYEWVRPTGSVTSLFGNQNFSSSFTSLSMLAALSLILHTTSHMRSKIFWICYQPFAFIILIKSDSSQGYIVLLAGLIVVGYFWLISKPNLVAQSRIYLAICFCGAAILLLDVLAKVPWNPILNNLTVSLRGDYWRAGWAMAIDNPIFGVGLDGYVYHYRVFRDALAASRSGNTRVDSAHNLFLDLLVGGGFPLLIFYLILVFLALTSIFKVVRSSREFKPEFAFLVAVWVAYVLQASISINQIGLGVVGFTLMGALIGFESRQENKNYTANGKTGSPLVIALLFASIFSFSVCFPLFRNDLNLRSAANIADAALVEKTAYAWPKQVDFMVTVAKTLRENGYEQRALRVIRDCIKINPNFYEAWVELSKNNLAMQSEKNKAKVLIKELDHFG